MGKCKTNNAFLPQPKNMDTATGSGLMEEFELMKQAKYRVYMQNIDKALKNFEYSSEWADLISALGKLNKVRSNFLLTLLSRKLLKNPVFTSSQPKVCQYCRCKLSQLTSVISDILSQVSILFKIARKKFLLKNICCKQTSISIRALSNQSQ